jgi:2-polyprenyl-6-methoxyphenol hydroxylase-like FAD-dependent oxidoreductase
MNKRVLISGAGFGGLTLAYWLNKFDYKVTVVEIGKELRKGGSPIDVRGEALQITREMGILEKIKAHEFIHTDEIVNAQDETLVRFSLNAQPEYLGDIEIHRDDLLDILFDKVAGKNITFLFDNSIEKLIQKKDNVEVIFKSGEKSNFDFVFGADGTHSVVRKLAFGNEENFSKFFGAYFAFAAANNIQTGRAQNTGVLYRELNTTAMIYQFKHAGYAGLIFRSPKRDYDYRNQEQHRKILIDKFSNNTNWKIPEILNNLIHADDLYFDEVSQIHMAAWTKGRVALVGDAAHATSFFTGMGTSLALQGATLLAKELHSNEDYKTAFAKYNETYKPVTESIQARITRGLKAQLPETEEELQAALERFKK